MGGGGGVCLSETEGEEGKRVCVGGWGGRGECG